MTETEDPGRLNLIWARTFVDELAAAGVRLVVVAPGSRSTPLVLAADDHPDIRTLVHLDERSAGFFALGVGKASECPAAVITTSGTAVANLLPAVVEASMSESPLLLLTADRPHRLRGADANQTIDQVGIFGSYPVGAYDLGPPDLRPEAIGPMRQVAARAVADAVGPPGGPVHVNFPFDKPLHPEVGAGEAQSDRGASGRSVAIHAGRLVPDGEGLRELAKRVRGARRGLVVSGARPGDREGARALAAITGFPLVADPLGSRFGALETGVAHADHYDLFLRSHAVSTSLAPDLVIRVGRSPTSAALSDHIVRSGADVVVIDDGRRWKDHTAAATLYLRADPAGAAMALSETEVGQGSRPSAGAWEDRWARAAAGARAVIEARSASVGSGSVEPLVTRDAVDALPEGGLLFASSSMPIRDVDAYVPAGGDLRCLGNRGASGIDGITSTALGSALASGCPTLGLIGDLAFLHDLNGLVPAAELELPVVVLVLNNDGGGIFHMLPIREHEPAFTRYFAAPHGLDFRHAGALYDLPFRRASADEAGAAVGDAFAAGGTHVIEVRSDRDENRRWRLETVDEIGARVAHELGLSKGDET